jgi:hypothetical protein
VNTRSRLLIASADLSMWGSPSSLLPADRDYPKRIWNELSHCALSVHHIWLLVDPMLLTLCVTRCDPVQLINHDKSRGSRHRRVSLYRRGRGADVINARVIRGTPL